MSGRVFGCFLLLALISGCAPSTETRQAQLSDPFPAASEVRLFVESGYDGEPSRASMANGITLSGKQRDQLEESLSVVPAPDEMAACFIPHHFFRYYNADGKQVGEIAACFCCGGVEISPDSAVTVGLSEMVDIDLKKLGILVAELGQPTDVGCGTE